jgi:hypothetical protein
MLHRFLTALVLTACTRAVPPAPTEGGSASRAPAAVVELRPLTITFRGQPIGRLFADGRTESAGPNAPGAAPLVPGPTLHADGTITLTTPGITARLEATGDISVVDARGAAPRAQPFGRIEGDQFTFEGSTRPWSVRVRGNLIEFGEDNSSQIEGEVTPGVRHTALVMAAAFYIDGAVRPQ